MPDFSNLGEVLVYLAGPAGALWWALAVSDVIRNLSTTEFDRVVNPFARMASDWFAGLTPTVKQTIVFAITVVPLVAAKAIVVSFPAEELARLAGVWQYTTYVFVALLAQKGWYAIKKDA